MISLIQPLSIGNAVRVLIAPERGASRWRVLRKDTPDPFLGPDDPGAFVVHDGTDRNLVDDQFLINGIQHFYCEFSLVGGEWLQSATVSAIPAASYLEMTWDAMMVLRDRLDYGLQVEVSRGVFSPTAGQISVLTAPPLLENTSWPVVTVQVLDEGIAERALGEQLIADVQVGDQADEYEGWLARPQIAVMAFSKNPDERVALRQAIRRLVIGNLPVFEAHGMTQVDLQTKDMEDFQSYNVPVYQVMATFSCTVPVALASRAETVREVITSFIR